MTLLSLFLFLLYGISFGGCLFFYILSLRHESWHDFLAQDGIRFAGRQDRLWAHLLLWGLYALPVANTFFCLSQCLLFRDYSRSRASAP